MVVDIRSASMEDVPELLDNVRQDDVDEMKALGMNIDEAVIKSLNNSVVAWCGRVDSKVVCMFGVSEHKSGVGMPWMFGTDLVDKYDMVFLRRCRQHVKQMHNLYPMLANYVAYNNKRALKWLKWLGFNMEEPTPYGVNNELFIPFWK